MPQMMIRLQPLINLSKEATQLEVPEKCEYSLSDRK